MTLSRDARLFWEGHENGNKEFFCIGDFLALMHWVFPLGLECGIDVLGMASWFGYCF
jgi:hypothetical protein